jgi:excisionase family DNA binding protein
LIKWLATFSDTVFFKKVKYDLGIMKEIAKEELLSRKEVAEFLKCSLITVDRYIRGNVIPSFRIGGLRRFSKKEILEFKKRRNKKKDLESS